MDDTTALTNLNDIQFIFSCIEEHGSPYGLILNKEKCDILLSTSGISPITALPLQLQTDILWAAQEFYYGRININGLLIIGVPFGSPDFIHQHQQVFKTKFKNLLTTVHTHIWSPQTQLTLYLRSIQHQIPFRQFIDGYVHHNLLKKHHLQSSFTLTHRKPFKNF
jgi:hypothetical protein